jgi:hypothetical protein
MAVNDSVGWQCHPGLVQARPPAASKRPARFPQ